MSGVGPTAARPRHIHRHLRSSYRPCHSIITCCRSLWCTPLAEGEQQPHREEEHGRGRPPRRRWPTPTRRSRLPMPMPPMIFLCCFLLLLAARLTAEGHLMHTWHGRTRGG